MKRVYSLGGAPVPKDAHRDRIKLGSVGSGATPVTRGQAARYGTQLLQRGSRHGTAANDPNQVLSGEEEDLFPEADYVRPDAPSARLMLDQLFS